jgi:hypothetical protein
MFKKISAPGMWRWESRSLGTMIESAQAGQAAWSNFAVSFETTIQSGWGPTATTIDN